MGSPSQLHEQGKYAGNGSAAAREFKSGQAPKKVTIFSANGKAEYVEHMGVYKTAAADGVASIIGQGHISLTEFGWQITSTDANINASGVEYFWVAE